METPQFTFSILVIEDTPQWIQQMGDALKEIIGKQNGRYRWDFSATQQETLEKVARNRYHTASPMK